MTGTLKRLASYVAVSAAPAVEVSCFAVKRVDSRWVPAPAFLYLLSSSGPSVFARASEPKSRGLLPIADAVESSVGAQLRYQAGIVVAESAKMQLLGPTLFGIEATKKHHEKRGKAFLVFRAGDSAGTSFIED